MCLQLPANIKKDIVKFRVAVLSLYDVYTGRKGREDVLLWRTKGFPTSCQVTVWILPGNRTQENNRWNVEIALGIIESYSWNAKTVDTKKSPSFIYCLWGKKGRVFFALLAYVSDAALGSEINYRFPVKKKKQWIKWDDQNMWDMHSDLEVEQTKGS